MAHTHRHGGSQHAENTARYARARALSPTGRTAMTDEHTQKGSFNLYLTRQLRLAVHNQLSSHVTSLASQTHVPPRTSHPLCRKKVLWSTWLVRTMVNL